MSDCSQVAPWGNLKMLKKNSIGSATLLLIAELAGCQHATEVANEPKTPEAQCATTAHLQYDRVQEDVRRQTKNPSYKFSFTSHYANKLGQCLILTESPFDTTDSSWHGMQKSVLASSSELFGAYSKRDGEVAPSRCSVYPRGTRRGFEKDASVECKSQEEFDALTKALLQ
jgi:hypothetical protein